MTREFLFHAEREIQMLSRVFRGNSKWEKRKLCAHSCHNVISSFYTGARKSADYRANMKVSPSLRVLTSKLSHGQRARILIKVWLNIVTSNWMKEVIYI